MINESPYMHVYFFYFFRGEGGGVDMLSASFCVSWPNFSHIIMALQCCCFFSLLKTDIFDDY